MSWLSINIKTNLFRIWEWSRVFFFYYFNANFLWADFLLGSQYFFKSTYRVHKSFLKKRGLGDPYIYGETPLTTFDKIVSQCGLTSKDIFFDLGCGPGRTLFWLNFFVKCRTVGIDLAAPFIERANRVKQWLGISHRVSFLEEDILTADLSEATAIYLAGVCFDDVMIEALLKRFSLLKRGTKIISVSYPLTEYCKNNLFKVEKTFPARFPWGKTEIFLNIKT